MTCQFVEDPSILVPLLLTTAAAGLVRGFAGFGAGLIVMPVMSALIDPRLAAATFLVTDSVLTLPMIPSAVRTCSRPTVLPAAIGALAFAPIGAFLLVHADPLILRWGISVLILLMLGLLVSGWRYHGAPFWPASVSVGALAGFLGGVAQVSGPPVVTYWMAGPAPAGVIRANLISFFFIATIGSVISYVVGGLFTLEALTYILTLAPVFAIAVFVGTRAFRFAGERTFRMIAYGLIAVSALTSLPILDPFLRS
jgi:uncharacterized membrane protein YfcA